MPRIVTKTAHGPHVLKPQDKPVSVCMCGLSQNQPFCDGSHALTLDEDDSKTYVYDEKRKRQEICNCKDCQCH